MIPLFCVSVIVLALIAGALLFLLVIQDRNHRSERQHLTEQLMAAKQPQAYQTVKQFEVVNHRIEAEANWQQPPPQPETPVVDEPLGRAVGEFPS